MNKTGEMQARWRHQELAHELRTQISDGSYAVGSALPTERMLAEETGVSRATVREALRALEAEGMIRRRQGSGTVVLADKPRRFHQPIASLETLLSYPAGTWVRLDSVEPAGNDPELHAELDASDERDWRCISLRRYLAGSDLPISLSRAYVPAVYAEVAEQVGSTNAPVYRLVQERFGVVAADIALRIDAVATPAEFARSLEVEVGTPATRILRAYRDAAGLHLEISITIHPAGRYVFEAALSPEG